VTPSWNQFPPYFPQVLPSYLSTEELVLSGKKYLWLTARNTIINTILPPTINHPIQSFPPHPK
jgi:hypothetical protein